MVIIFSSISSALLHKYMYIHEFSSYVCIFIAYSHSVCVYGYVGREKEIRKIRSNFHSLKITNSISFSLCFNMSE